MAPTMAPTISQSIPVMAPTTMPITIPTAATSQSMSTTIPTTVQPTALAPVVIDVRPEVRKQIGRVIAGLINNTHNLLGFMHKFTVDADANITILQGFLDNPLIFRIVVHLIWCSDLGISEFLSATMPHQLQQLDYAIAAVGAAVKLALWEQIPHPPVILPFMQVEGSETFNAIVHHIGGLDGVQKIILNHRKSHMLNIGNSQVLSTNVLAQLDMMMAEVQ
ncbi:hypothetical protein BDR05DRAFT_998886 [Suillus weaverae]|nr:hypothetical protein BDR05DRAFT_998886 [Suillus weaverae]